MGPAVVRYAHELGILGIMVQTALLTGVVLYLLSRFTLPFGSITLLAGLVMAWVRPGPHRIPALRLASFIGPVGVSSLYLLALEM